MSRLSCSSRAFLDGAAPACSRTRRQTNVQTESLTCTASVCVCVWKIQVCVSVRHACMHGWMATLTEVWMDGRMDGWMDACMHAGRYGHQDATLLLTTQLPLRLRSNYYRAGRVWEVFQLSLRFVTVGSMQFTALGDHYSTPLSICGNAKSEACEPYIALL